MGTGSGRPLRSLRQRLIVGITVTAALAAFSEAMLLHLVWSRYEQRLIERVVLDELRRSVLIHEREPQLAYPNTGDLTLYVSSDDPAVPDDPVPDHLAALQVLQVAPGTELALREVRGTDGVDYYVGVARRGPLTFQLVYDARGHAERGAMLLWAVIAIAAALTLMAAWLARGMVERLLAGLSTLQRRVADGGADPRSLREPGMDVEVAALAEALDDHRRQVAAALRKERAFAAAASHELRTPLTRIATGAEVLLAQPALAEPVAARVRQIRESADELQRLLEVLLQVARWQPGERGEAPANGAARPLGELVDGCVRRLDAEARLLGVPVTTSVATPARAVAHPAMLEIVLSNLLRNAIRHGRGAPVGVIARDDGVIEVVDAGPGIDAAAIGRVFDPFWREASGVDETGPSGLGLGLTIAERICAVAGWSLSIASSAEQGTCATVRLDPGGRR
jgi:two-component system sensor histidine kinase MprB